MYRKVHDSLWADPAVKRLCPQGKLLFVYLITGPQAHLGGIYVLPPPLAAYNTGIKEKDLDTLWDTLSMGHLAYRDGASDVVWVRQMLRYQGSGAKIQTCVQEQIDSLPPNTLVSRYIRHYEGHGFTFTSRHSDTPSDTLSHTPCDGASLQEQIQIQRKDTGEDNTSRARGADSPVAQTAVSVTPPSRKKPSPVAIPDWLDADLWADWLDHRKRIRKPMTDRAQQLLLGRLEKHRTAGHNIRELMETAIMRGWLDVYPQEDKPNGRNGRNGKSSGPRMAQIGDPIPQGAMVCTGEVYVMPEDEEDPF